MTHFSYMALFLLHLHLVICCPPLPQLTHSSYYIRVVNSQLYSSQYHGKGNNEI